MVVAALGMASPLSLDVSIEEEEVEEYDGEVEGSAQN